MVKVIKKNEAAPKGAFHRFAVVHIEGKKRMHFRVWHRTREDAEAEAKKLLANGSGFFVMETVSVHLRDGSRVRKLADVEWNDAKNYMARQEVE